LLQLRDYRHPADYAAARELWKGIERGVQLGRSDEPAEIGRKVQHDPDLFIVAESEGMIVGSSMGGFDGRRGLLYHLSVAGPYRKKGIGRQLMREVEQRPHRRGCLKYYLLVTKDNPEALEFYRQEGRSEMDQVHLLGKELRA